MKRILPLVGVALISNPRVGIVPNEELINYAAGQGLAELLITNGEEGADFFDGNSIIKQGIIKTTNVVDMLGTDGAFAASFMIDYLSGGTAEEELEKAAGAAAGACTYYGVFGRGTSIYHREKDS